MDNRKQINVHLNVGQPDDAALMSIVEEKSREWGVSASEAGKRLLMASLGMSTPVTPVVQTPVVQAAPSIETTALIQAITALTHEIVALRQMNATLRATATKDVPRKEDEIVYTEDDLNLPSEFVSAVKKAKRPGMRLEN